MRLPDMRYLALHETRAVNDTDTDTVPSALAGFVSFMATYEDGREVLYIYEVHLAAAYQGKGLGRVLVQTVEGVGARIGVEKCMLTVFRRNQRAWSWYVGEGMGYAVDESSPGPVRLRGGRNRKRDYVILSKRVAWGEGTS